MDKPSRDVNQRIDGLERHLRCLTWIGAVAFVGFLVLLGEVAAWFRSTRELTLRDQRGQVRARLGVSSGVAGLTLHDPQGRTQIQLQAKADGTSSLSLGPTRIVLTTMADGPATLDLNGLGTDSRSYAMLFMGTDGTTGLRLSNDHLAITTAIQPDGLGGMLVTDRDGRERGRIGSLPDGVTGSSLAPVWIGKPLFQRSSTSDPRGDRCLGATRSP
jgi:hypothetical protein